MPQNDRLKSDRFTYCNFILILRQAAKINSNITVKPSAVDYLPTINAANDQKHCLWSQ